MLVVTACGHQHSGGPAAASIAHGGAALNTTTVADVVAAFGKAGLAVTNQRDVTDSVCPGIECVAEVDADGIAIIKFPSTAAAERFVGSHTQTYQAEDIGLAFGPAVPDDIKAGYERVVRSLVARD